MGWAKYWEDNIRIADERQSRPEPIRKPTLVYFDCPYCSYSHTEKEGLYYHIKNNHNISRPILVINGSVVSKAEKLFVREIKEAVIYPYGLSADLTVNGVKNRIGGDRYDLKPLLNVTINKVILDDTHYTITLTESFEVNNPDVNRVIELWQKDVASGKHITKHYSKLFEPAETSYLNGIFDYLIACIAKPNEKKNLYESAYSILSGFSPSTSLANTILKIIAFRLNWLSELKLLCSNTDSSKFLIDFYLNDIKTDGYSMNNSTASEKDPKVFIEDDLLDCLNAVIAFSNNDMLSVDNYLANKDESKIADSNLRDKVLLLLARKAICSGNTKKARRFYEEIKAPFIEQEKAVFMEKFYSKAGV